MVPLNFAIPHLGRGVSYWGNEDGGKRRQVMSLCREFLSIIQRCPWFQHLPQEGLDSWFWFKEFAHCLGLGCREVDDLAQDVKLNRVNPGLSFYLWHPRQSFTQYREVLFMGTNDAQETEGVREWNGKHKLVKSILHRYGQGDGRWKGMGVVL